MLEYSKHCEHYTLFIERNLFYSFCIPIGWYRCAHSHPNFGELDWCESNHGLNCIFASTLERIKNRSVSSSLIIKVLTPISDMIGGFAGMLICNVWQHLRSSSRILSRKSHVFLILWMRLEENGKEGKLIWVFEFSGVLWGCEHFLWCYWVY